MKCEHISQSRINLYSDCPFAYYLRYSYEGEPFAKTHIIPLENGSAVHSAIEENLIRYRATHEWDVNEVIKSYVKFGTKRGLKPALLKEMSISLKTWAKNFIPPTKMLEIEKRHDISVDGIPVVLITDMIEEEDKDTLVIHDWKTNVEPYNADRMRDDIQAPMYLYIVMKYLYPDYKNYKFKFQFVRHDLTLEYEYTRQDLDFIWAFVREAYVAILEDDKPYARPTYNCTTCPGMVHGLCPLIKTFREHGIDGCMESLMESLQKNETFADDAEMAKAIVEDRAITGVEKIMKGMKTTARGKLSMYLSVNDLSHVEIAGHKISIINKTKTTYDPIMVFAALERNKPKLLKAIDVRKGITDGYMKDGTIGKHMGEQILNTATKKAMSSYIMIKKAPIRKEKPEEDDSDGW